MTPAKQRTGVGDFSVEEDVILPATARIHRVVVFLRALLFVSVILPLGLLAIFALATYQLALADMEELVQRTVDVLHEHALKVFDTQELILDQAASLIAGRKPDETSDAAELNAALARLARGRGQIASIWLIDSKGYILAASRPWPAGTNGSDRDYFQAHMNGEIGTYIGRAFVGRATAQPSFGFSRRWPSADGAFGGVMSISVSSDYFSTFFRNTAAEIEHVAAMIRTDGAVIASNPPRTGSEALSPEDPLMRALAHSDRGILWRVSRVDGVERLYGYRHVDGYPVAVTMAVTRSAALQPWLHELLLYAGATFAASLALFSLALFGLRQTRREETALLRFAAEARQRAEIEARLRLSQKLEALGQMTGTVAHDFGNLLTPILGNLHLLQKQQDDPRSASRIRAAIAAAERGEKLVRSLLAFARQEPRSLTIVDVNALLADMEHLLMRSLDSVATLTIDLAPELWPAYAEVTGLEMAVLNLVINARDAMRAGGTVRISTANAVLHGEHAGLTGEFVAIVVSDTGSGMSPEVLARAFEPFFTTKALGKGTGLGLASIYGFAEQCRGGVTISSEAGKGTTATLYLPRAQSGGAM